MGIIKASKLIYDYIRRDEDDHVEEVKRAIDDLTLDIKQGDFVAILGHNGSGKSTFAKQMNGILLPTDGTVWISGMNTSGRCPYLGYSQRPQAWCSRTRITRSSATLWRRMWDLARRIWECLRMKSGAG